MIRRFLNKAKWLFVHRIPWKPILLWSSCLLFLFTFAFYGIVNWRGARAWEAAQAEAAELGVSLDLKDFLPVEVPASENILNLPVVTSGRINDFPPLKGILNPISGLSADRQVFRSRFLHHYDNEPYDISQWLPAGHPYNNQQEAAQAIDTILADRRDLVAKLTALPQSFKFYKAFDDSSAAIINYEQNRLSFSSISLQYLIEDDGIIAISLGDSERALANILFYLSLSERFDFNPTFHNDSYINGRSAFLIWNFVKSASPTPAQINLIIKALQDCNEPERFKKNLGASLAYNAAYITACENDLSAFVDHRWKPYSLFKDEPRDHLRYRRKQFMAHLILGGHFKLQKASRVRELLPYIQQSRKDTADYHLKLLKAHQKVNAHYDYSSPLEKMFGYFGAFSAVDAFGSMYQQNYRSVLLLALKAESYRIEHGSYPESPNLLGEESYLDLPAAKPLHYEILPDGTLLIRAEGTLDDPDFSQSHSHSVREIEWMMNPAKTAP